MKTRLLVFITVVAACSTALGRSSYLDRPLFGWPSRITGDQLKNVKLASTFMHEELKFLEGRFINQYIHHRFGGTAQQTTRFLDLLNDAACFNVRVQFRDFGEQETAFTLDNVMGVEELTVTINSGRKDFGLRDFQAYLPKPTDTKPGED